MFDILSRAEFLPHITEKSQHLFATLNQVSFNVHSRMSKADVEKIFVLLYGIHPLKVNLLIRNLIVNNKQKKVYKKIRQKKAVITLPAGVSFNYDVFAK